MKTLTTSFLCLLLAGCSTSKVSSQAAQNLKSVSTGTTVTNAGSYFPAQAKTPIDRIHTVLMEAMKSGEKLNFSDRYRLMEPVIKDVFDFDEISQIALGDYWKTLSIKDRSAFTSKLIELAIATYSSNFNHYEGEQFVFQGGQSTPNNKVLLTYTLETPGQQPIKYDYWVNMLTKRPKIANIDVDGISDLALKNAQYTSVIQREGLQSLINKMTLKISEHGKKEPSMTSEAATIDDRRPTVKEGEDLDKQRAKSDCAQLYKVGSKDYGNCVMQLLK